jgi:hypothetical protein
MHSRFKLTLVMAASCILATAAVSAVQAQSRVFPNPQAVSQYQNPDGSYRSLADYVRDVEGTPCGMECTRVSQRSARDYYGRADTRW